MRAGWIGLCLLAGCSGSEACVDFADEVLVVVSLTDDGDGARVEVALRRASEGDDSIPVRLCAGDSLTFDGAALAGVKRPSGAVVYEAEVASETRTEPVVHTLRHEGDGASEFTAEIHAPGFAISAPEADAKLKRAEALAVAWAPPGPAGATLTLRVADEIDGEQCLEAPVELEEADDGEATVAAGTIVLSPDKSPTATCEGFVTLSRRASVALEVTRGGATLHPDSRMEATNSRAQPFRSVP
jgi:hypothetical protein